MVPMSVAVGDSVLVPEYGGTKLTFDEQVWRMHIHTCMLTYIYLPFSVCIRM